MAKTAAGDSGGSGPVRIAVRVKPGAARTRVGGTYPGGVYGSGVYGNSAYGEDGALIVAVQERAVDGKATEAALRALADALGVPRRAVALVAGATSRDKLIDVEAPPNGLMGRLAALRAG